MEQFSQFVDKISVKISHFVSWMAFLLVMITIYDVLMRYVFKAGSIWIQEAEWHLFAANFMLAASWVLIIDGHVRVDIFYANFKPKTKAWINVIGTIVFLIPYCILIIWCSIPFVYDSWAIFEGSSDPGGLPGRYLLKTVIPVTFALLLFQGISEIIKNVIVLKSNKE